MVPGVTSTAASEPDAPLSPAAGDSQPKYRFVMFGGMVAVYFAFGVTLAGIPPMITEVRTDLGMGRGAMGLALGAWTAMYIFTSAFAGRVVDRIGIGRALFLGGLSLTASGFARSFATGPTSLWFAIAIMGLGGPLVSSSAPTLCSQWFSDQRERQFALSMYNLGPSLGSISVLFATNSILLPWLGDWRSVIRFEATLALGATLVWAAIAWRAPAQPVEKSNRPRLPLLETWRGLVASSDVRHTLILGTLTFFVGHSLNSWMIDAVSERAAVSAGEAANWVSSAGMAGLILLFVLPLGVSRFGRPRLLIASWAISLAGLALVGFGPPALVLAGSLTGGVRTVMVPLIIMTLLSAKGVNDTNIGAANGLWFSSAQVGAVAGPFLVGLIADTGAGFRGAMALLIGVGLLAVVLIWSNRSSIAPAG